MTRDQKRLEELGEHWRNLDHPEDDARSLAFESLHAMLAFEAIMVLYRKHEHEAFVRWCHYELNHGEPPVEDKR